MSTAEVAKASGTTPSTVTRWVDAGKLTPAYKGEGLRGFYMFESAHVAAFLKERAANPSHAES